MSVRERQRGGLARREGDRGAIAARPAACGDGQHAVAGVDTVHRPARPDTLGDLAGQIARTAPDVEHLLAAAGVEQVENDAALANHVCGRVRLLDVAGEGVIDSIMARRIAPLV
jgi:hypothetical protein